MRTMDLASLSAQPRFQERVRKLAQSFDFSLKEYANDEDFFVDTESYKSITAIVLDCAQYARPNEVAGLVQVARQGSCEAYIIVIASSKMNPEDTRIAKTSGASLVIMENEFYVSSKLEFVLSQVIRSAYIPLKVVDLIADTAAPFDLFHLLPINRKFVRVLKSQYSLRQDFLDKYAEVGDLYIQRRDLAAWVEYSNSLRSDDEAGQIRTCRLRFLQMNQSFLELALMISDQSTASSFSVGRELFESCRGFSFDLHKALAGVGDPWKIISSSAIGDFGSVERCPAIAAYAGVLSSRFQIGFAEEVMIGALLSDIGYLELSPSTTLKIREGRLQDLNAEEQMEYFKHPIFSLNSCLSRKLPLTEAIKDMILMSHERMDQKGFPHRVRADKITEEAMLVRFCWELDSRSQLRLGQERPDIENIKRSLLSHFSDDPGSFSVSFATKLGKLMTPDSWSDNQSGA